MRPIIKEADLRKLVKGFGRTPVACEELLRNEKRLLAGPPSTLPDHPSIRPWRVAAPLGVIPAKPVPGASLFGRVTKVGQLTRAVCCAIPPLLSYQPNRMVERWALLIALLTLLRRDYLGWFDNEQAYNNCVDEALDRLLCLPMRCRPRTRRRWEQAARPVICVERSNGRQYFLILDCLPPFVTRSDYEQIRRLWHAGDSRVHVAFRFVERIGEGSDFAAPALAAVL